MNEIEILDNVLTVGEVSRMWGKGKTTIMWHIWRSQVVARQDNEGGRWLIWRPSVVALWGKPLHEYS